MDEGDKIISLAWSPIECPRVLLTMTLMGNCYVWSQSNGVDSLAVNVWHGSKVSSRFICHGLLYPRDAQCAGYGDDVSTRRAAFQYHKPLHVHLAPDLFDVSMDEF